MLGRHLFSKRSGSFGREDGVLLSGYLTGNVNKIWKKRYFELKTDHTLSYYKNKVSGGNLSKKEELKLGVLTLDPLNTIVEIFHEKENSEEGIPSSSPSTSSSFNSSGISSTGGSSIRSSGSSTSSGSGSGSSSGGSIFFNSSSSSSSSSLNQSSQRENGKSSEIVVSPQIYDVKKLKEEKEYMLNSKMIQCIYRERYRKQRSFRKERKQSAFARISKSYQESPLLNGSLHLESSASAIALAAASSSSQSLTSMTTTSSTSYFFLKKVKKYKFSITVGNSQSGGRTYRDRKYTFYCETEEERDMWIRGIISSIEKQVKTQVRKPYTFETPRQYSRFLNFIGDESQEMIIHALNNIRSPVQESFLVAWMVVMDCFSFHKSCIALVKAAIKVELELTKHPETLFRRNSISTKLVQLFFKIHGQIFLKSTLQQLIAKVCIADEYLEIEESRLREFLKKELDDIDHPEKPTGEIIDQIISSRQQRNRTRIIDLSKQFLNRIISNTINDGPFEICEILEFTYEESKRLFPDCAEIAVGGLFFLRFICPAIISPHLQGILSFQPQTNSQRTLTLVTKVIQNIANQVYENNTKEEYMSLVSEFVTQNIESTKEFIRDISSLDQDAKKFEKNKRLTMRFGESNSDLELNCYHVIHEFFRTIEEGKKFHTQNPELFKFYTQMLDSLNESVKSELIIDKNQEKKGSPSPQEVQPKKETSPIDASKRRRGATKLNTIQELSTNSNQQTRGSLSLTSAPIVLNFDRMSISESKSPLDFRKSVANGSESLTTSRRRRGGMHNANVMSPSGDDFNHRESFSVVISNEIESAISQQIDSPRKVDSPRKDTPLMNTAPLESVHESVQESVPECVHECVQESVKESVQEETPKSETNDEDFNNGDISQISPTFTTTNSKDDELEKIVIITSLRGESTPVTESDEAFTAETPNEIEDRALLEQIISTTRVTTTSMDLDNIVIHQNDEENEFDQVSESSTDEEEEEVSYNLLEIFGKGEELSEEEFINLILKYIEESGKEIIAECDGQTTMNRVQSLIKNKFIISLIAMFSLRLKPEKGVWQLISNLCSLSENERLIQISNQLENDIMEFKGNHSELDSHQHEYICFCSFICRAINMGTLFETLTYLLNIQELDLVLSEYYSHESDYDSDGYELDNIDLLSFPIINTKSSIVTICEQLSFNLSKKIPHCFSLDTSFESCNISFM